MLYALSLHFPGTFLNLFWPLSPEIPNRSNKSILSADTYDTLNKKPNSSNLLVVLAKVIVILDVPPLSAILDRRITRQIYRIGVDRGGLLGCDLPCR
jgi:hypothetical protein